MGGDEIESQWELHNLTLDPEERTDRSSLDAPVADQLREVLEAQRERKRLRPRHTNP